MTMEMDRAASVVSPDDVEDDGGRDFASGGARRTRSATTTTLPSAAAPPRSTARLHQLALACERHNQQGRSSTDYLPSEILAARRRRDEYHESSRRGLPLLLERVDREAEEERRRAAREEDERIEGERRAADEARIEEERRREAERVEALANAEAEAEEEARRKGAHVHRAVSLIENLDKVRSSVQGGLAEFDKSKAVSRRRLQFQKIVNGKINTLTHDAGKILEVGGAVCDAIENAARDDAENSGPRQEPVLSVGKKYLLDLLCSNLVVRVQADGFNGTRGDGFPLANAFAHVSTRCEEIGPVLEGHLYTVCPMAIPVLRWS